jgi:hypothetical protein
MRAAVRLLILIWATVSVVSLVGLIYVFPGYSIDSAFSEALRSTQVRKRRSGFIGVCPYFLVGALVTAWLYRTYRKHYGRLWKSY